MQRDMTRHMLATFHEAFAKNGSPAETRAGAPQKGKPGPTYQGLNLAEASNEEMEGALSATVLKEFKTRLGRIGLEYQPPA